MSEIEKRRLRDQSKGPGTLIGQGCKLTGSISGSGYFQISGEIEGDCNLDGTVSITKDGVWRGVIRARTIIIAGIVEGDIVADGSVEIGNTARISGTVTGKSIAVAEGAIVDGVMKTAGATPLVEFKEKRIDEEQ